MRTVISALHFQWYTMTDCLETAALDLGLDGVELSWHDTFSRPHCTRKDLEILSHRSGYGDVMLCAHIWDNIAEADLEHASGSLLSWLDVCGKTCVKNLVIHGGTYSNQAEGVARVRRVFENVLPAFERAGVVLNLENHYAYDYRNCRELFSQSWEFLEVLNLDSPSLKFCLDTGHGNMTRNTGELIDTLAPWLSYVHLADNHGMDDDHVPYGRGTVAWEEVFDRLGAVGSGFTFCVEFPVREEREPFHSCLAEIRRRWPDSA